MGKGQSIQRRRRRVLKWIYAAHGTRGYTFVSTGPVRPVWSINMKGRVSASVILSVSLVPVFYPERDHVPGSILNHILPGGPAQIFIPDWACGFFCPIGCQQIGRCRLAGRLYGISLFCVLFQYSCLTRNAAAIIDVAFSAHDLGAPALSATRGLVGEENVSSKPPRPQSGSSQIRATVGLRLPAQDPITSSHRSVILLTTPGHTGVHPTQGFRIQRVCSSKSQPVRRLLASHAPSVPCP
jgi:hypothetical protein